MPMAAFDVDGASILIAGASGGLGSAVGALLAERGATLTLVARRESRLEALPFDGLCVGADIRRAEDCEQAVQAAVTEYGRLDGLINAAGVVAFGQLADVPDAALQEVFETNVLGPLRLIRAALPHLKAGVIVNITAVVAERPMAGLVPYCAAKAALSAASKALQLEMSLRGGKVRVIDVRPPHTETGLADRPIAGRAPKLTQGLDPARVAARILAAIENGDTEVASSQF